MARTTAEEPRTSGTGSSEMVAGIAGGIVAGVVMGLIVQFGTDLLPVFGRLLGEESVVLGWIVHLVVSAAFGLFFALLLGLPFLRDFAHTFSSYVILAVIHATVLATVFIGVVFPVVSNVLGLVFFPIPGIGIAGGGGEGAVGLIQAGVFAVANLVYGLVLGAVYAVMQGVGPRG